MTDVTNTVALRDAFSFRLFSTSNIPLDVPSAPSTYLATDYPRYTMVLRPGPLRDLPLERFIDVRVPPIPATPPRTYKRPLSPGTPNLFSPTKKRILAQEGVFSPEKTVKSFIVPSDRALVIHDTLRQGPARRLDFGQSPRSDNMAASTSYLLEDCFMESTPKRSPRSRRHDHDHSLLPIPNTSSSQLLPIPSSSSNPQTVTHYPGFNVWVDCDLTHSSLSSHSSFSSLNHCYASDEDKENSHNDKENEHPKTKWRSGLSERLKSVSFKSPEQVRRPNTPKIPFTPLNARRPFKARLPHEITPGKVMRVDRDEMKRRRVLLAMELDGDDDSDVDL